MLTRFLIAGLIPGMMASPIALRQGANVERREPENSYAVYAVKPMASASSSASSSSSSSSVANSKAVAVSPVPSLGPSVVPTVSPTVPALPTTTPSLPVALPTTPIVPALPTTTPSLPVALPITPTVPALPTTTPSLPVTLPTTPSVPAVPTTTPSLPVTLPTTPSVPAVPTTTPSVPAVPVSKQAVPNSPDTPSSSFPVAPPPRVQTPAAVAVPAGQYAVKPAPAHYPTHEEPVSAKDRYHTDSSSTPVVAVVAASAAPSYPVKNEYAVKSAPVSHPPVHTSSKAAAATPSGVHKSAVPVNHAFPSSAPIAKPVAAANQYAVADPPVYSHAPAPIAAAAPKYGTEEPLVSSAVAPVRASSAAPLPTYSVKPHVEPAVEPAVDPPVYITSAVAPVKSEVADPPVPAYHVDDPPVHGTGAVAPVEHPIASSAPAYIADPPVHSASAVDPVRSFPVTSSAPVTSHHIATTTPAFSAHPIASSLPVEDTYAVQTPVEHAKAPEFTPDPNGPSGHNECQTRCNKKCAKGDKDCRAMCLNTCHAERMLSAEGTGKSSSKLLEAEAEEAAAPKAKEDATAVPATAANAKSNTAAKSASDTPTLAAGAGYKSYEACMSACKGRFQHADIVFPISQGKYNCAEACAEYKADGAGVAAAKRDVEVEESVEAEVKRDVEPSLGALRPVNQPAIAAGAGYVSYEACMEDCQGRYQSANIVFEISQGKGGCKKACAKYEKDGSSVSAAKNKRAVEPSLGALRPTKPALAAGAGYESYEACVKACNGRYQSTNIVFGISQGRKDCKKACVAYEADGSGVNVVKKEVARPAKHMVATFASGFKKVVRAFPFEGNGPFNKPAKDGPFTKTPETTAGASTSSYEACMHGCTVKLQSADVAFDVAQGDDNCATQCAKYSSNGAEVTHL
ncbi:hypothetical protein F4808DRAFT_374265 [Astrocystis sublimbata]|nr:hypothetical protein F4808DRAFT_374265 [Astrocystis sublimbata]